MEAGPSIAVLFKALMFLFIAGTGYESGEQVDRFVDIVQIEENTTQSVGTVRLYSAEWGVGIRVYEGSRSGHFASMYGLSEGLGEIAFKSMEGHEGQFSLAQEVSAIRNGGPDRGRPQLIESDTDTWRVTKGKAGWYLHSARLGGLFVMPRSPVQLDQQRAALDRATDPAARPRERRQEPAEEEASP
jgi:hypothetical protein